MPDLTRTICPQSYLAAHIKGQTQHLSVASGLSVGGDDRPPEVHTASLTALLKGIPTVTGRGKTHQFPGHCDHQSAHEFVVGGTDKPVTVTRASASPLIPWFRVMQEAAETAYGQDQALMKQCRPFAEICFD